MPAEVRFERAGLNRLDDVLAVLDEAAGWLSERGVTQWPARFEAAWIEESLRRGETWLVSADRRLSGTVTLDWADPLWDDRPARAGYLHRIAVCRHAAGLGTTILAWAAGEAREQGAEFVRLDCVSTNARLRAHYESHGFRHRGDVGVHGAPGQREACGPSTLVSRYELPVGLGDGGGTGGVGRNP